MSKTVTLKKGKGTVDKTSTKTTEANAKNVKENVKKVQELKYLYPKDPTKMEDGEKKTFRRQARASFQRHTKAIAGAKGKEQAALKKEANVWAQETYAKGALPKF